MYYEVRLVSHIYWEGRHQFALDQDRYEFWTIFAPVKGKFSFKFAAHSGEGEFGRIVICPPNTDFARKVIDPLTFHFFHFRIEADSLSLKKIERNFSGLLNIEDHARLRSTYRFIGQSGIQREMLEHFLNDLWLQATTQIDDKLSDYSRTKDHIMIEAKIRMAAEAFGPISLRSIASSQGLTPVQLTRRFNAAFGITPIDFLTKLRLERACRLLSDTRETLEQIASQCGYESGFYLSRLFRNRKGMSPSEYRRLYQV